MRKSLVMTTMGVLALASVPSSAQQSGPRSVYWVDAGTTSGFAAMGSQGTMGMMGAMMGGGGFNNLVGRDMQLRLGSSTVPASLPTAEHLIPPTMKMGKSLPLRSPVAQPRGPGGKPGEYEMPKARLLLFWGCGDVARKGQPIIFDFSKIAKGQFPPGLQTRFVSVNAGNPPSPTRNRSYGDWPNSLRDDERNRFVPKDASLIGPHTIRGNYTQDINFTLAPGQDFMAPVKLVTAQRPSSSVATSWQAIPMATGYHASFMGSPGQEPGPPGASREQPLDLVIWSSSELQAYEAGLQDYLPPAEVARLVGLKVVMPPTQTTCTIPAEVLKAAPQGMLMFNAFGPEANFAFPPRPADPKVPWNLEWTTKVRYKSSTMALLGTDMGGGPAIARNEPAQTPEQQAAAAEKAKQAERNRAASRALGVIGGILR